jgi:hypothetical protein
VTGHPMEVRLLSQRDDVAAAQSLSTPLQGGVRFLHLPLPAVLSACLTTRFPSGRTTGLPRSVCVPMNGVGLACSPVAHRLREQISELLPLATCLLAQACQHLWLVCTDDV